jgi:transposase-like protein
MGMRADGKRAMLGVSVAVGEHEAHWRQFLQSLVQRGLHGVQLIVSDAHDGLQAARRAVFGGVPWQRCQFHLQQNAQAYVPRQELKAEVAADIRAIFTAPNRADADRLVARTVQKYANTASKLATWRETVIPEGLTVFSLPAAHRTRLRTVNALERLNQEIRRRTRVVGVFPNAASCLRLVSALAMETSDEWEAGKTYLTLTD